MDTPREIKQGDRVVFVDNSGATISGSVNGQPWVYFQPTATDAPSGAYARVPVYVDDGRTLDVAGHNIRGVVDA